MEAPRGTTRRSCARSRSSPILRSARRPPTVSSGGSMPKFFKTIFGQVVVALVVGIALGVLYPEFAASLKPLGDTFIKLVKIMIAPIVFCVVVHGIAGAGNLKKVGRVGVKAVVYFEIVTTIALVLGIAVAYLFQPGAGMNIDTKVLDLSSLKSFIDTAATVKSS